MRRPLLPLVLLQLILPLVATLLLRRYQLHPTQQLQEWPESTRWIQQPLQKPLLQLRQELESRRWSLTPRRWSMVGLWYRQMERESQRLLRLATEWPAEKPSISLARVTVPV